MRGLKTLSLRIGESLENAYLIQEKLESTGYKVKRVLDTNILLLSHDDEKVLLQDIQANGHNLKI